MQLIKKFIGENSRWRKTSLEEESFDISCFYDLEQAKKILNSKKILVVGVKLLKVYDIVK